MLQDEDDTDAYTDKQMQVVKAAAETQLKIAKDRAARTANTNKRNASTPPYAPGKQTRTWDNKQPRLN